ncbi:methionyl-tRNA formyltransferase [Spiroplasma endosymbiont of Anurida maritima]|uniref:methionyl-tRNA formyltransferase n=1 Tax=Spiroplasma endosymbiont of Anurida maritima TaxID=2967972 RepID=UPI0036D26D0E
MYNVVFLGTPIFAKKVLNYLKERNDINIVCVITQPDKQVGRKKEIIFSPVKKYSVENNLKIFQPNKIKDIYEELDQLNFDLLITCAYGQFIPESILKLPKIVALNIHASLLPKLRGGAPIHKSIVYGEKTTGISLMEMVKKMDAGDVFVQEAINIEINDNFETLRDKLITLSINMLDKHLIEILKDPNNKSKQDETKVSFALNITKEERQINWNNSSLDVYNQIRGYIPEPISFSFYENKTWQILGAEINEDDFNEYNEPGIILNISKNGVQIACKQGSVLLTDVKKEGQKLQNIKQFYKNNIFEIGKKFT